MISTSRWLPLLASMAMVSTAPAWAADDATVLAAAPAASNAPAASALALPAEKQAGNISYLSGGVPDEQLPAIRQARSRYPLVVELYQKSGARSEYTSGAQVQLLDKAGKVVLDDQSDGPFMLIKLPPGTYRVQASLNGKTVKGPAVTVAAKGSKRAVIVFPQGTD